MSSGSLPMTGGDRWLPLAEGEALCGLVTVARLGCVAARTLGVVVGASALDGPKHRPGADLGGFGRTWSALAIDRGRSGK